VRKLRIGIRPFLIEEIKLSNTDATLLITKYIAKDSAVNRTAVNNLSTHKFNILTIELIYIGKPYIIIAITLRPSTSSLGPSFIALFFFFISVKVAL